MPDTLLRELSVENLGSILLAMIDQYGLFGATARPGGLPKLAGLVLMLAGVTLLLRSPSR